MNVLMKLTLAACLLISVYALRPIHSSKISSADAIKISEKIWKNECGGTVEGLTHWNKAEEFPSLGIGHFIWYPSGKTERFKESFPTLLQFLEKEGAVLPAWLKNASGCPWQSREEFYNNSQSPEMLALRQFLYDTRDLQAIFIANQLEDHFLQVLEASPQKDQLMPIFLQLAKSSQGLYALIDYLNFKGAGTSSIETYGGHGWGLLQVLQNIPASTQNPLEDFVKAAKFVLSQRVQNSPPERNEKQWLPGWFKRLDTYLSP